MYGYYFFAAFYKRAYILKVSIINFVFFYNPRIFPS